MINKNTKKQVTLLIGSPKKKNSASAALGTYLCNRLDPKQFDYQVLHLRSLLVEKEQKKNDKWLERVFKSDIIVFSSPLYVDCLPSYVFKAFEMICQDRRKNAKPKPTSFLAIVNSGFPESTQNKTALDICYHFASESKMEWLGGFPLGGGSFLGQRDLRKMGWIVRNIRKSLDLAATAINYGEKIPKDAFQLIQKPVFGTKLYCWMGNFGFKHRAKQNGVMQQLYNRPYQK